MNMFARRMGFIALLSLAVACGDKSPKSNSSTTAPVIGQILPTRGPTVGGKRQIHHHTDGEERHQGQSP